VALTHCLRWDELCWRVCQDVLANYAICFLMICENTLLIFCVSVLKFCVLLHEGDQLCCLLRHSAFNFDVRILQIGEDANFLGGVGGCRVVAFIKSCNHL